MLFRPIATRFAVILMLGAFMLPGCAPKLPPAPMVQEAEARALLDQAEGFYAKRQYEQALQTADAFVSRYPKSRQQDRAQLLMGDVRMAQRNYQQALSHYTDIIEKYPASALFLDARYKLGICYFEIKEYELAIANLEDRSRIADPAKLQRIAEALSATYLAKGSTRLAVKEFVFLAGAALNAKQRSGYRDRIRELVSANLSEKDLTLLAAETGYPADLALLRLAGLMLEQKKYRDAISLSKDFLARFPAHPDKTRAEMLAAEAATRLTAPRYALGALIPQSGAAAFYGDQVLRGVQLAVLRHNLKDPDNLVELLIKDTEGSSDKAAAAFSDLASRGIVAAIGPLLTREVEALVPIMPRLQVPVITPAASGPGLGELSPWIFRNALTNVSQARAAAQHAVGRNLKKFVIMYPDDPYGRDLSRLFSVELEKRAEVLSSLSYPPDSNDFGPVIKRLMEIDLRSRRIPIPEDAAELKKLLQDYTPSFDAMYLPGAADRVGLLIPQLAFYNITGIKLMGSGSWHTPDLIERAGRHAEGAVFTDGFMPENKDAPEVLAFVESYRSAYQEEPGILSAQAYDAAMMALSLIEAHRNTPTAIRDGLASLNSFPGISGLTTFNNTGEAQKKVFLITIENGLFTPVKD